ncbi:hypothetical protein KY312_03940, partial [Candidatus Woesearchaeota archaeon]|nr:hypothetical protein [Candidatus Woesearchaeota archaeon]
MLEKRGQVTIFIILGIIILFSAGLVYYLTAVRVGVELPEKFIRETPEAVLPIRYYVDDCIQLVAREAVEEIGMHGGWILTSELSEKSLEVGYDATESDAVRFTSGGAVIPYWHYMKSENDCTTCQFSNEHAPTLSTMANEISRFIDDRLENCIRNFEPFVEEGFVVKKIGEIETSTQSTEKIILVQSKVPLEIEREGKSYRLEDFAVPVTVNLKKIYELALKIMQEQVNAGFLERNVLNLISYTSTVDKDALPPFSETIIDPGLVFWSKSELKKKIKELLITYMPLA